MSWRNLIELVEMDDWKELSTTVKYNHWDPNERDKMQQTPLHVAAKMGRIHCVDVLIEGKADINAVDMHGVTPLHNAVMRGQNVVVEMLVKAGADINAASRAGKTPLDYAAEGGMIQLYLTHMDDLRKKELETAQNKPVIEAKQYANGLEQPLQVKKPLQMKPKF